MSDDQELPFYSPDYRPPQAPRNRPAEPLWSVRVNHVIWSCELRFHGESYGWSAIILRDGELFTGHGAFVLKGDAIEWAEGQRKGAERGFLEDY
jgi:hypothetical protein